MYYCVPALATEDLWIYNWPFNSEAGVTGKEAVFVYIHMSLFSIYMCIHAEKVNVRLLVCAGKMCVYTSILVVLTEHCVL